RTPRHIRRRSGATARPPTAVHLPLPAGTKRQRRLRLLAPKSRHPGNVKAATPQVTSTATYLQAGTLARGVVATTVGRAAMVIPARSPTPYGAITPAARTAAASRAPTRAPALLDPTGPAAARRRD
ncbi:unnamed protein product, partial [Pylaiella littoralis]